MSPAAPKTAANRRKPSMQPAPPPFQARPTETVDLPRGRTPAYFWRQSRMAAWLLLCVSRLFAAPPLDYAKIEQAIQERRFSWAQQQLESQILAEPQDFRAQMLLGGVFSELNQLAGAIKHFEQAARLQPREAAPHLRLGESYARQGKFSAALAEFQKAVEFAP